VAILVFIPEKGDGNALQGARQEGSHSPEGRINPDAPRYHSEVPRHEDAPVEEDDRRLDTEDGGGLESLDDPDRLGSSDTRFRRRGGPVSLTILSFSRSDLLTVPSCSPRPTVKPVPGVSQRRRRIEAVYRTIKVANGKPKAQE
jgi:hypothetical protein